jgi:tripartite-type tricarboxylate transporter receptor subunit TctC
MRIAVTGGLVVALVLSASPGGKAQAPNNFYSSKQITLIAPTSAGGGFDLYSRIFADSFRKHIPGQPVIVVQNMPGAGGVRAAGYVYSVAARDGTVIGMPLSNIPLAEALAPEATNYKSAEFSWIGNLTPETEVLAVWRSTSVLTIADARAKELTIGGTGKLSTLALNAGLVKALLGAKFRIIHGYPSGNEVNLAMENGEVQGRTNQWSSWKSQRPAWIKENRLSFLVQIGPKEKELPDVPSFIDLVTSPADMAMVRLLQSNQVLGRSIFGPPGIPADRLAILRVAFDKTTHDPEFLARTREAGLDVNPRPGHVLAEEMQRTMKSSTEAARDMKRLLNL